MFVKSVIYIYIFFVCLQRIFHESNRVAQGTKKGQRIWCPVERLKCICI